MATFTPNYNFVLPGVGDPTDQDLWGGYLNSNLSSQDNLIKTATDWVKNEQSAVYVSTLTDRNKIILCDATGGAFNVTLLAPAVAGDGFAVMVKKEDVSANAITIVGTIDGAANLSLPSQYDYVILVSDGVSSWNIVSKFSDVVGFATDAEVEAGTVTDKAIAPDTLSSAPGFSKAWANVSSAGSLLRGYRITSVARAAVGRYTVVLADTYADTNYLIVSWSNTDVISIASKTTAGFEVQCYGAGGSGLVDRDFGFIIMDT